MSDWGSASSGGGGGTDLSGGGKGGGCAISTTGPTAALPWAAKEFNDSWYCKGKNHGTNRHIIKCWQKNINTKIKAWTATQ